MRVITLTMGIFPRRASIYRVDIVFRNFWQNILPLANAVFSYANDSFTECIHAATPCMPGTVALCTGVMGIPAEEVTQNPRMLIYRVCMVMVQDG